MTQQKIHKIKFGITQKRDHRMIKKQNDITGRGERNANQGIDKLE